MKKPLVIAVIVAVVILGALILISRSKPDLQNAINEAKSSAVEASMRAFVAATMTDMAQYYSNEKNTAKYYSNPANKQVLDTKLAELNSKYPGNYSYKIYDEKENASVKAAEMTSGTYVCIDSLTVKSITISADEFAKSTDCAGQVLK